MVGARFDTPQEVIFPTLVLALFLADVLPHTTAAATQGPLHTVQAWMQPARVHAQETSGPISTALQESLTTILSEAVGSFFGTILASAATRFGIEAVGDFLEDLPIIKQIRQILTVVALIAQLGSLLRDWTIILESDGGVYHYIGGGGSPTNGVLTAHVDSGGSMELPASVKELASIARVPLPEVSGPEGSVVVWTPGAGWAKHAHETQHDSTVNEASIATLSFDTSQETQLDHDNGTTTPNPATMQVTVERNDVEQLSKMVGSAVRSLVGIPGIGGLVGSLAASGTSALTGAILNPKAEISISVETELHPWESHFVQPGSCGGEMTLDAQSCAGLGGPWTLTIVCSGYVNDYTSTTFAFDKSIPKPPPVSINYSLDGNSMDGKLTPGTTCENEDDECGKTCTTITRISEGFYNLHIYNRCYDLSNDFGSANGGQDVKIDWSGIAQLIPGPKIQATGKTIVTTWMGTTPSMS